MSLTVAPNTAAPGASVLVSGRGRRKASTRVYIDGIQVLAFIMGNGGTFNRTVTVPALPDGDKSVVEKQPRSDGVWAQVDSGTLAVKAAVVIQPGDTTKPVISGIVVSMVGIPALDTAKPVISGITVRAV